ncbi:dynein intermediate chain 3, ciliary [Drosophila tropicalis]|uniref:dynein intermediate chain 3, ciliary n=1 Tax=Drosophila tropicalis TaxID=46794 RepID=UPI0035ABA535
MYQNQFIYSRERRRFGRQCLFGDHNELMVSVHPSGRLRLKYIMGNPSSRTTQLSDQFALSVMTTENVTHEQHGMYHYEGGWPKEVNINDEEQTQRHRKKVERDDTWGEQITQLIRTVMAVGEQNNAINIYQDYFADLTVDIANANRFKYVARGVNVFHDIWHPSRHLTNIEWMPNNDRQFMVQFTNLFRLHRKKKRQSTDDYSMGSSNSFYIWDVKNPLQPKLHYDCLDVVSRAKICPKDENNLAGGNYSGKVCIWATHATGLPIRSCPLEAAHREKTSALCWVHSKSNTEFYSGSLDGAIKYWDTRDLKMPVHELLLETEPQDRQDRQKSHGVTFLEFEYTIPVRFIIGSDMGCVFVGNRKGMTPAETLLGNYQLFAGPIRSINRNPFFVKNFLIVGDWRARIWSEESKDGPSTMYIKKDTQLTCGAWSTARCSLFVTGDKLGVVDFYDLLLHQRKPFYSINFHSMITDLVFRSDGELLAIGLANGDCHVLTLNEAMKTATGKEKALIASMFEREISRSKILEARVEEMKLKRRTRLLLEEERIRLEQDQHESELELDPDNPDQFVEMIKGDPEFRAAIADVQNTMLQGEHKRSKRHITMQRTVFEQMYLDKLRRESLAEEARRASPTRVSVDKPSKDKGKSNGRRNSKSIK